MTKEELKIVFFGTPDFAVESLKAIVDEGYNVIAAVTMPDKPAGRGHKMYQSPVKEYALSHQIPLLQPTKLKDPEFLESLKSLNADLFIVIAFRMLPEAVWTMPPLGTFNLHASLLPRYRGAAPINWAVINGDTETGVTTFFLKHEIDTGDIISQERVTILPEENVGDVHDKLMTLGAKLTIQTIQDIISGTLTTIPQDKLLNGETPTPAPKIFKETCRIDWDKPAQEIHNLIRGLSPYPAAWTELYSQAAAQCEPVPLKIFSSHTVDHLSSATPGTLIIRGDKLWVVCGHNTTLEIMELQPSGKRRMSVAEFLRGARLESSAYVK